MKTGRLASGRMEGKGFILAKDSPLGVEENVAAEQVVVGEDALPHNLPCQGREDNADR